MRETVTIYVPDGYKNADEFLKDCEFEKVVPPAPAWDAPYNYNYEPVERRAAEIYDGFIYPGPGEKPKWIARGNGLKQDVARRLARSELRAAGHAPPAVSE